MSLIADALKAAQRERDRQAGVPQRRAHRVLEGGRSQRTVAVEAGSLKRKASPAVLAAGAVLVLAVAGFGWVLLSGPDVDPVRRVALDVAGAEDPSTRSDPVIERASDTGALAGAEGNGTASTESTGRPPPARAGDAAGTGDATGTGRIAAGTAEPGSSSSGRQTPPGGGTDPDSRREEAPRRGEGPTAAAVPVGSGAGAVVDESEGGESPPSGLIGRPTEREGPRPAMMGEADRRDAVVEGETFRLSVQPREATPELFQLALVAHRRGDLVRAAELYEEAARDRPDDAQLYNNLGAVYRALGRLDDARSAYRRALAIEPSHAVAWSNLGVVLESLDAHNEAIAAYLRALQLDAGNAGARINLANAYRAVGQYTEALALLEQVIRADPTSPEAYYAMGQVHEGLGDRDAAVRSYNAFLDHAAGAFPALAPAVRRRVERLTGGTD